MNTENITFLPSKVYADIQNEISDNLRCSEYIQYGYIKLRDLGKWDANEVVSVKMGQLSPYEKCYRGKSVLDCAVKRIDEQDTTACFDDEDELIPIYVFIAEETDNDWRKYLISKGYKPSRANKSREGIRINRKNLFAEYGFHYDIETKETISIKEEKEKIRKKIEQDIQRKKEENKLNGIAIYNKKYGENSYEKHLLELKEKCKEFESKEKENDKDTSYFLMEDSLSIKKTELIVTTNHHYDMNEWSLILIFSFVAFLIVGIWAACDEYTSYMCGVPLLISFISLFLLFINFSVNTTHNETKCIKDTYYTMFGGTFKKIGDSIQNYVWDNSRV